MCAIISGLCAVLILLLLFTLSCGWLVEATRWLFCQRGLSSVTAAAIVVGAEAEAAEQPKWSPESFGISVEPS